MRITARGTSTYTAARKFRNASPSPSPPFSPSSLASLAPPPSRAFRASARVSANGVRASPPSARAASRIAAASARTSSSRTSG